MGEKARNYSNSTKSKLQILSGNECAAPDCTNQLIARDGDTIIAKICHIEAANENGPRFNPQMCDMDRSHFNNLILLCDECHRIIDNKENESKYPVALLKEWKKNHEEKLAHKRIQKLSLLKQAVNAIAQAKIKAGSGTLKDNKSLKPYKIDEKISFNAIKRNKAAIDENKIYYNKLNTLYKELEKQGDFRKDNLLHNIGTLYLKVKGKYILDSKNPMEIICARADDIFEEVENELLELATKNNSNIREDISFEISIIMVDAFIKCKILEDPKEQ